MFRSARHRSPIAPRWVRGLLAVAFLAFVALNSAGCTLGAISYVAHRHLALTCDRLVDRVADLPVTVTTTGRGHQARRARQSSDPRPDSDGVCPGGLPRPTE